MTPAAAAAVFGAFAFTYFFSALLRAVTATLAPVFSHELGLTAADLGLLAGVYFLGFALMQLPLGHALDRHGPRRVLLLLLAVAVLGCSAFALAPDLPAMIAARALIGVGVAACLMAPLTAYRTLYAPAAQLRANAWMLMTGSLGMLASTLPVQMLLPQLGWRGLFWCVAAMLLVAMALIRLVVPADTPARALPAGPAAAGTGYREIARHPLFRRMLPLAFTLYGGLIAVQSLWAGPWLTQVGGVSPAQAANGLFTINLVMLVTFLGWGVVMPGLARRGLDAQRLMRWGVPLSLALLGWNVWAGAAAGAAHWAAWCAATTVVSLSQPAVGQAFAAALAGRALSAFNLAIFGGVFCVQWGVGLTIDALQGVGIGRVDAYRIAFGGYWLCCCAAYAAFVFAPAVPADNRA